MVFKTWPQILFTFLEIIEESRKREYVIYVLIVTILEIKWRNLILQNNQFHVTTNNTILKIT